MILEQHSYILKMQCHVDPAVYVCGLFGTGVILYVMNGYLVEMSNYDLSLKLLLSLMRCEELRHRVIELEDLIEINDTEDKEQKQE